MDYLSHKMYAKYSDFDLRLLSPALTNLPLLLVTHAYLYLVFVLLNDQYITGFMKTYKLNCNTSKTSYVTIGSWQNLANAKFLNLELDNRPIEHKPSTKLLGVHIDEMLTWDNQIKYISSKVSNGLRMLYLARKLTDNQEPLKAIDYSLVQPYFDYCDVVWGDCSKTRADKLQKLQNRAARINYSIRSSDVLNSLEWSNLEHVRRKQKKALSRYDA